MHGKRRGKEEERRRNAGMRKEREGKWKREGKLEKRFREREDEKKKKTMESQREIEENSRREEKREPLLFSSSILFYFLFSSLFVSDSMFFVGPPIHASDQRSTTCSRDYSPFPRYGQEVNLFFWAQLFLSLRIL